MRIVDLLKKAFIGGIWAVGYREREKHKYNIIPLSSGWIADPFLFEYQDEHYLFAEYVSGKKGEIAYFKFIDNEPVFQKVVISEPYHLSYPCVFTHGADVYMIPESADNHSIDLYKAISFPNKWVKVSQLAKGIYYDTTYVNYQGKDYFFTYSPKIRCFELSIFQFDVDARKAKKIAEIQYKKNLGRPAGRLYIEDGKLVRPAQDCSRKYGENLFFYKVEGLNDGKISETLIRTISAKETDNRYQRIHTYNRDSVYETVDFFKEQFQLLRPFRLMVKIAKQRFNL